MKKISERLKELGNPPDTLPCEITNKDGVAYKGTVYRQDPAIVPHDGKLDENGLLTVGFVDLVEGTHVEIEDSFRQTWIKPAHALSLRDWLIQNSPKLEQLVKGSE